MKTDLTHLDKFRPEPEPPKEGEAPEPKPMGGNGIFLLPLKADSLRNETVAICVANDSCKDGWEHVSVAIGYDTGRKGKVKHRPPSVDELRAIKDTFWDLDEPVQIYFSSEMNRVTDMIGEHVVHLWKPKRRTLWQWLKTKLSLPQPNTEHLIPSQEDIDRAAEYDDAVARAQKEAAEA